jgi:hypothetical protein
MESSVRLLQFLYSKKRFSESIGTVCLIVVSTESTDQRPSKEAVLSALALLLHSYRTLHREIHGLTGGVDAD